MASHTDVASLPVLPATPADVPEIVALAQSAYRGESARKGWTHESDLLDGTRTSAADVSGLITDTNSVILTLRDEAGTLLACCNVARAQLAGQETRLEPKIAYFGLFAVSPLLQGGGIGKKMMQASEEYARVHFEAEQMQMTVICQRTELIDWYVRHGYRQTGERRPFPAYEDSTFGLPRRADLEFVVLTKQLL